VSSDPGVAHHVLDGTSTLLVLEALAMSGFRHELLVALLALEAPHGAPVGPSVVVSDRSSSSVGSVVGASPDILDVVEGMASGAVSRFSSLEDDAPDHVLEFLAELVVVTDVLSADFTAVVMVSAGVAVVLSAGVFAGMAVVLSAVVMLAGMVAVMLAGMAVLVLAGVTVVLLVLAGVAVVLLLLALLEIVVFQILSEIFALGARRKVLHMLLRGSGQPLDFAADLLFDLPKVFTLADVTCDVD